MSNKPEQRYVVAVIMALLFGVVEWTGAQSPSTRLHSPGISFADAHAGFDEPHSPSTRPAADTLFRVLEQIEVTATRQARSITRVPGRVGVVTADELSLTPAATVADALRGISGVHSSASMGFFTMRPAVTVRGLSGEEQSRTLVLVDGVPVNNTDSGGVNWNSIHLAGVQQIEVYKGPGSTLYGSNAMGGVINIRTREQQTPLAGSAGLSHGTYNTTRAHLGVSGRITDRITLQASGFGARSDGYNATPLTQRPSPDVTLPRYVDEHGLNVRARYRLTDRMHVSAGYERFRNERGEGIEIREPGTYRRFDQDRVHGDIRGELGRTRYHLRAFFQRESYFRASERLSGGNYSLFHVASDRDDRGLSLDLSTEAGPRHSLSGGWEWRSGSVDGGDFYQTSDDVVLNGGTLTSMALWAQDEITLPGERVHLQLGVRLDHVTFHDGFFEATPGIGFQGQPLSRFNDQVIDHNRWITLSPRAAVRYTPVPELGGYVAYSRGFRASILDDLSRTGIFRGRIKVANADLGPETLDNIEAGLDWRPGWRWLISPTVFYAHGNDFLYYVSFGLDDGLQVWRRENVSSVRMSGAELDVHFYASDALTLTGSYSLHTSEILSFPGRTDLEGKQLTFTPRHQLSGSAQWRNRLVDTGVRVLYRGAQFTSDDNNAAGDGTGELDAFITLDLIFSRSLHQGITLSLDLHDITDNRYMESTDLMSPGRMLYLGLRYDLSR